MPVALAVVRSGTMVFYFVLYKIPKQRVMPSSYLWGIDLGGTKVEGVVIDPGFPPIVLARKRLPTERELGYEHIIGQIARVLDMLSEEVGFRPSALGAGTPGTTDPATRLLKNSNTLVLNDRPFRDDLEKALGIPVAMANDANCFAAAEACLGAVPAKAPGARVVFGVIMGTGVGGGLVIDGKPWGGKQGIGGEWGHTFLDDSGGHCYCGHSGCVEMIISGPALERYYNSLTGTTLSLSAIVERHLAGTDAEATATVERLIHFFGKGMANVINIVDPDVIVLGGGLGNIPLLYTEGVASVGKFIFNNRLDTVFLKPELGDSAGVFGAALLAQGLG